MAFCGVFLSILITWQYVILAFWPVLLWTLGLLSLTEGLTWSKLQSLLPLEKCAACVETSALLTQVTKAVQMAASRWTVPPLRLCGQFQHMKQIALKNATAVQSATPRSQLHFQLITCVECYLLLQDHLVDATALWTHSPSFRTVSMTCVSPTAMKTCFAVVWGSTCLHARMQVLRSSHGGVRSAVSIIYLGSYSVFICCDMPVHTYCSTYAAELDLKLVGHWAVYINLFLFPSHSSLMPWKLSLQYMHERMPWVLWWFIRRPLPVGLLWGMSMWPWIHAEWEWLCQSWEMWLLVPWALLWGEYTLLSQTIIYFFFSHSKFMWLSFRVKLYMYVIWPEQYSSFWLCEWAIGSFLVARCSEISFWFHCVFSFNYVTTVFIFI